MSRKISKYRIYCNTDDQYEYTWNDTIPTVCPVNDQHIIDTNTISIIDTVETNSVNIIQETTPTGGNYRTEGKKIELNANETKEESYSWPYPISALTFTIYTDDNNGGDLLNCYVAPNTVIGILTSDTIEDSPIIHVNSTVLDNMKIGYMISINGTFVGECLSINKTNSTIISSINLNTIYTSGSYIQLTINTIKDFVLKANTTYEFARKTIGSKSLPTDTIVKVVYQNNTNESKNVYFSIEYLY